MFHNLFHYVHYIAFNQNANNFFSKFKTNGMLSLYTSQAFQQVQIYIFLNSFGASIKYFTATLKYKTENKKKKGKGPE